MSDIIIPMEAVQYLDIVQVVLYFFSVTCFCLAAVCVAILLGND